MTPTLSDAGRAEINGRLVFRTDTNLAAIRADLDAYARGCRGADLSERLYLGAVELLAEVERLRFSLTRQQDEIQQALGKALGYPRFADDQVNFPGSTEADGVCVFDHVAETLAAEAADTIRELRAMNERAISRLGAACEVLCQVAARRDGMSAAELRAKAEELKEEKK